MHFLPLLLESRLDFLARTPDIPHMITCFSQIMTHSFCIQFEILFRVILATGDIETQRVPVNLIGNSVTIKHNWSPFVLAIDSQAESTIHSRSYTRKIIVTLTSTNDLIRNMQDL